MSSRALNETPWDKKEDRERDLDEEVGWDSYRITRHLLFSSAPVESQMPLYRWPYCASVSKSLSSISLIRGERTRVGRNGGGGVPGKAVIALMSVGSWLLLSFLPPCINAKFECVIYLTAGENGSSGGSHLNFCCFNELNRVTM